MGHSFVNLIDQLIAHFPMMGSLSIALRKYFYGVEVPPWLGVLLLLVMFGIPIAYLYLTRKHAAANALPPLIRFACEGNVEKVISLLDAGEDINQRSKNGGTALIFAVSNQEAAVTSLLLRRGADVSAKSKAGMTAEELARKRGNKEIQLLFETFRLVLAQQGDFPKLIRLPEIIRERTPPTANVRDVKSVDDLPKQFVVGDLVSQSFSKQVDGGWVVEYRDPLSSHKAILNLDGNGNLAVTLSFFGREITAKNYATTFTAILNWKWVGDPAIWDAALKERLEAKFNIQVSTIDSPEKFLWYLPDGPNRVIFFPFPVKRMLELAQLLVSIQSDTSFCAPIICGFHYQFSSINYVEGKNPKEFTSASSIREHHTLNLGTPVLDDPVREVANSGSAAWTLRRFHYLCVCSCFIRDVTTFVELLASKGFIGSQCGSDRTYPNGPEFSAGLMPAEKFYTATSAGWFSPGGEMRIQYFDLEQLRLLSEDANPVSYDDSIQQIEIATNLSRNVR